MDRNAIIAVIIFVVAYGLIIAEALPRSIVTFTGAVLLLILGLLKDSQIVSVINWDAMGLIFGMFVLVRVLVESGFFDYLSGYVLKKTKGNPLLIFLSLSIFTGVIAAFMDSITVMLFMASLTINVAKRLDADPVPFILSQITAANIGGTATLMGNPPNIILGTGLGITLNQFLVYLSPIVFLILFLNAGLFVYSSRKTLKKAKTLDRDYLNSIVPKKSIKDMYMFTTSVSIFLLTITLLIIRKKLGLSVGIIGVISAALVLFLNGNKIADIWEKIDWEVIIFFATLFIIIGGLEVTGVIQILAKDVVSLTKGSAFITKNILLWSSGIFSGVIDNVPFAASMVPLIKSLVGKVPVSLVGMGLITTFGTDVGGNLTPIGASPNVVGLSILKNAGIEVSWKDYLKKVVPITIVELIIANVFFVLLYH